jgi:hypothetical protein
MRATRATKTVGFSVPPAVVKQVETIARQERRTKSELFQEMVRVYQQHRAKREKNSSFSVDEIIAEVQAEKAVRPWTREELLEESKRLRKYGIATARKHGIKARDIDRVIHEGRRARKA